MPLVKAVWSSAARVRLALWLYAFVTLLVSAGTTAFYMHTREWYFRPLFAKDDRFRDLTNYTEKTAHLLGGATALGFGPPTFNYPAPAAFVLKFLLHAIPGHPIRPFLMLLMICVLGLGLAALLAVRGSAVKYSAAAAIGVTVLFGYPLWFDADRGNIEGVAWAVASAGLCFFLMGKYRPAAVLIGLASCVKPFPVLFLLLLVVRKRYRDAAIGALTAGLVVFASFLALGPNPVKAYAGLKPGVARYVDIYVEKLAPPDEARFEHSILDGLKSAVVVIHMRGLRPHLELSEIWALRDRPGRASKVVRRLSKIYPAIAASGLAFLLYVFYRKPLLNQMTALAVAITLFSPSSGDYTLLHLYVPFGATVIFLATDVASGETGFSYSAMLALAVIYALIFSPLTLMMIYAGDGKLILLIALVVVAARFPMRSTHLGGAEKVLAS